MLSSLKSNRLVDGIRLRRLERQAVGHTHDWDGYRRVLAEFMPRTLPRRIYLNQIWPEWKRLMEFLSKRPPKRILEIGTGLGGSTYFLTKLAGEGSLVVTVDAEPKAASAVSLFGKQAGQRVRALTGSSHDPLTVEKVAAVLRETPVDLLYIDGDHSYEGVKKDFELYRRFCGPDSIACFHDIIPDYGVTKGIQTEANTGEVYKFWAELKASHRHEEIVEDHDQNGFGIGVIYF
jgi:predicted O-methyltransferase YrrM